jgi:hypothetical protein
VVLFDDQKFNQKGSNAFIGGFSGHLHMFGPFMCQPNFHVFVPFSSPAATAAGFLPP